MTYCSHSHHLLCYSLLEYTEKAQSPATNLPGTARATQQHQVCQNVTRNCMCHNARPSESTTAPANKNMPQPQSTAPVQQESIRKLPSTAHATQEPKLRPLKYTNRPTGSIKCCTCYGNQRSASSESQAREKYSHKQGTDRSREGANSLLPKGHLNTCI